MSKAGDITISLVLDGADDFKAHVRRSSDALDGLSNAGDRYDKSSNRGRQSTRNWTAELRDYAVILGLARSALENLSDLFLSLPRAIIQQNAMLERNTVLIEGMAVATMGMGDAQKYASEQILNLFNVSSSSPYAIESIIDAFTKLKVGGIQDTEKSLNSLINTSAKFGSTSEQLKRGSIAIQQMMGKGVISMEELRQQLGEAIPDIMNIMSRSLLMPMDKMVKMIATGTVKAGPAIEAMFAEMYYTSSGYAERMSNTWDGLVNQFRNQMTLLSKTIGDAGFFEEMKSIMRDMGDLSSSDGFSDAAYNFGEGLAIAARSAYELVKALGENLKLIAAIGAVWAGGAILRGIGELADGAVSKWDRMTAENRAALSVIQADRLEAMRRIDTAHESAIAKADKMAQRHENMTTQRYWRLVDEYTNTLEARARADVDDLNRRERQLNGFGNQVKNVGIEMLGMVGGWTTVITAAVIAVIYLYDELWGKQLRAAGNINDSMGGSATVASVRDANDHLKRLLEERSKIQEQLNGKQYDQEIDFSKSGWGASHPSVVFGVTKSTLDRDLSRLNAEIDQLERNLVRADQTLANTSKSYAKADLQNRVSDEIREISAAYSGEARKIQDEAAKMGGKSGEEFMRAKITALRSSTSDQIKAVYEEEIKYHKSQLDAIQTQANKSGKYSDEQKDKIRKHTEAIKASYDGITEAQDNINRGGFELLSRSEKAETVANERLHTLLRQNEGLQAQNRYLSHGGDLTTEQSKMIFEIASKYKDLPAAQQQQLINAAKINDQLRQEGNLIERNIELYKQAMVRIGNMEAQVAKKLGRARAAGDNPLMNWQAGWLEELERVDVIRSDINKSGKATPDDHKRLDNLIDIQREINGLAVLNDLKKKATAVSDQLLTTEQRMAVQHARNIGNLTELRKAIESSTAIREKDRQAILGQIDELERLSVLENKQQSNPLESWSKSVTEMAETVDNVLVDTMTGFFDAVAEAATNSEASFSDMMDSMFKQLSKFFVKLAMMQAVQSMFGSFGWVNAPVVTPGVSAGAGPSTVSANPTMMIGMAAGSSIGTMVTGGSGGGVGRRSAPSYQPDRVGQMQPSVNIINQTGVNASAEAGAPRFDGEKFVTDIVMSAASRPGKFRNAMKGI